MPHQRIMKFATSTQLLATKQLQPDPFALAALVKDSSVSHVPALGKSLHGLLIKLNLASRVVVEKALMQMYSTFGTINHSCRIFDNMARRDSAAWNVLLSGYTRARLYSEVMRMFRSMRACDRPNIQPTPITLAVVLPACARMGSPRLGTSVHGHTMKRGLDSDTLVGNALVSMYAKCGPIGTHAIAAFRAVGFKDVVSWNSIVAGFSENGLFEEAFGMFYKMASMGVQPNCATIVTVLPICALVKNGQRYGKEIHCHVLRFELDATDVSVCNGLVIHYSKVGDVDGAEAVFAKMDSRDIVTWNTVISGYTMNGFPTRAMDLFRELTPRGVRHDSVTLITILRVCTELTDIEEGRKIHRYVLDHPILLQETSVGNALFSFYGKCAKLTPQWRSLGRCNIRT